MSNQLLLLELNEINFDNVAFYCARGELPNLHAFMRKHGWARTVSEQRFQHLEPWIQWVTAHTGLTFAEHQVFRLGDIVKHDVPQIWERLEDAGLRVGAISPMNAKHRLRNPAFFVPDPWTSTGITARPPLIGLYKAIVQAVNDNAQSKLTLQSLRRLVAGFGSFARLPNYPYYARLIATSRSCPWRKAIVLDLLLADVFFTEVRRASPDFASLFLNSGAHIQHHYMFSAACYAGEGKNPEWYCSPGRDPVLDVYECYDRLLGAARKAFPRARIMIATGLTQVPHEELTYYWRLRRHGEFLARIRVPHVRVEPRMSRDFLVVCDSPEQARYAEARLSKAVAADGARLFDVDNRGQDLFVTLSYPRDIGQDFVFSIEGEVFRELAKDVVFVAIKNGKHDGRGYFLDSGSNFGPGNVTFALKELPNRIEQALDVRLGGQEDVRRLAGDTLEAAPASFA